MTLLTINEVAERLRVSRSTVLRLQAQGRLRPVHPTPGRTLFTEREIEAYVASLEKRVA